LSVAYGSSYILGAVETFLKAVPSAGIFRGNESHFFLELIVFYACCLFLNACYLVVAEDWYFVVLVLHISSPTFIII